MPIRLKVKRQEEQRISKVKELMQMFKVPNTNSNYQQYELTGASLSVTDNIDPRIQKTKDLFQMFHLAR